MDMKQYHRLTDEMQQTRRKSNINTKNYKLVSNDKLSLTLSIRPLTTTGLRVKWEAQLRKSKKTGEKQLWRKFAVTVKPWVSNQWSKKKNTHMAMKPFQAGSGNSWYEQLDKRWILFGDIRRRVHRVVQKLVLAIKYIIMKVNGSTAVHIGLKLQYKLRITLPTTTSYWKVTWTIENNLPDTRTPKTWDRF